MGSTHTPPTVCHGTDGTRSHAHTPIHTRAPIAKASEGIPSRIRPPWPSVERRHDRSPVFLFQAAPQERERQMLRRGLCVCIRGQQLA